MVTGRFLYFPVCAFGDKLGLVIEVQKARQLLLATLAAGALLLAGCGSSDLVDIVFGSVAIDTVTVGSPVDPDGYLVRVTGPSLNVQERMAQNDQISFAVAPGEYTAELEDLAANCSVDFSQLDLVVVGGITARAAFNIECS